MITRETRRVKIEMPEELWLSLVQLRNAWCEHQFGKDGLLMPMHDFIPFMLRVFTEDCMKSLKEYQTDTEEKRGNEK